METGSPACDAGLRPNDLLTHVNGETVQNLTHTDVIQRLMAGGDTITLRVSPLESTSIRQGGARKTAGKLVKRKTGAKQKAQKRPAEKSGKRRASILRRFSGKRDSFDANALAVGSLTKTSAASDAATAANLTQLAALQRSVSNTDGSLMNASLLKVTGEKLGGTQGGRHSISIASSRGSNSSRSNDSASSIESNSAFEPPAESANSGSVSSRPSSFRGLKSKVAQTLCPPSRRKQPSQTMPLSPLARSQPSQQDFSDSETVGAADTAGRSSPSPPINITQPPLLKPIVLAPVVQKKAMVKLKNSDSPLPSACLGSPSPPVNQTLSPGSQSNRATASRVDSAGSTSSNANVDVYQKKPARK